MQPSLGDKIQRSLGRKILAKVDFDIVISGDSLVLSAPERVKVLAIKVAHDVGHFVAIVVYSPRDLMRLIDDNDSRLTAGTTKRSSVNISVPAGWSTTIRPR